MVIFPVSMQYFLDKNAVEFLTVDSFLEAKALGIDRAVKPAFSITFQVLTGVVIGSTAAAAAAAKPFPFLFLAQESLLILDIAFIHKGAIISKFPRISKEGNS